MNKKIEEFLEWIEEESKQLIEIWVKEKNFEEIKEIASTTSSIRFWCNKIDKYLD